MLGFIKKIFIALVHSINNASNQTNCLLLSNQQFTAQLSNLHPN